MADDKKYEVKFAADGLDELADGVEELNDAFDDNAKAGDRVSEVQDELADRFDEARDKIKAAEKSIDDHKDRLKESERETKKGSEATEEFGEAVGRLPGPLSDVGDAIEQSAERPLLAMAAAATAALGVLMEMIAGLKEAREAYVEMSEPLDEAKVKTDQVTEAKAKATAQADKLKDAIDGDIEALRREATEQQELIGLMNARIDAERDLQKAKIDGRDDLSDTEKTAAKDRIDLEADVAKRSNSEEAQEALIRGLRGQVQALEQKLTSAMGKQAEAEAGLMTDGNQVVPLDPGTDKLEKGRALADERMKRFFDAAEQMAAARASLSPESPEDIMERMGGREQFESMLGEAGGWTAGLSSPDSALRPGFMLQTEKAFREAATSARENRDRMDTEIQDKVATTEATKSANVEIAKALVDEIRTQMESLQREVSTLERRREVRGPIEKETADMRRETTKVNRQNSQRGKSANSDLVRRGEAALQSGDLSPGDFTQVSGLIQRLIAAVENGASGQSQQVQMMEQKLNAALRRIETVETQAKASRSQSYKR